MSQGNPSLSLQPASTATLERLTTLLNSAFSDYALPLQVTDADLESMIVRDDVALAHSWIAYRGREAVGLALVAQRSTREGLLLRLATMGVVPTARRQGVATALLERVIAVARERAACSIGLEVLEGNRAARRLYERWGFVAGRRLCGGTLYGAPNTSPERVVLRPAQTLEILSQLTRCTRDDGAALRPPWQLDAPSLARYGPPSTLATIARAEAPGIGIGYLVVGGSRPIAGLIHLAIEASWRRQGLATAALARLFTEHPDLDGLYIPPLIPEHSPLLPFLSHLGAVLDHDSQIEMTLSLTDRGVAHA